MRKLLLLLVTVFVMHSQAMQAQDRAFEIKNSLLSFGVGFGWSYPFYNDPSVWPSFSINYEKGLFYVKKVGYFGIGGFAAYHHANYNYPKSDRYIRWQNVVGTVRFTFHPNFLMTQNFEMYAGVMGGARYEFFKDTQYDAFSNPALANPYDRYGGFNVLFAGFIGMRFYTGERLGFFAEGGYGLSFLNIGITWKFGERNIKADPGISKRGIGGGRR